MPICVVSDLAEALGDPAAERILMQAQLFEQGEVTERGWQYARERVVGKREVDERGEIPPNVVGDIAVEVVSAE